MSAKTPKWNWRGHLTDDERMIVEAADGLKEIWKRLNTRARPIMINAIHRAKYRTQRKGKK